MQWANVSDTGGWHKPHVHGGCAWAGIFYVASPASSPSTVFMKMSDGEAMSKRVSAHRPGTIVIIPGSLVHYVPPNPGPEPRITVSFNVSVITRAAREAAQASGR